MDDKLTEIRDDIFLKLSDISLEKTELENVTIRIGDSICQLKKISDSDSTDIIDEMRNEYKQKVSDKLKIVGVTINEKIAEYAGVINSLKSEYTRKERELDTKLKTLISMPDVTFEHAKRGLSVVKGESAGTLVWLVRRMYNPKFVDREPLKSAIVKKMLTPIIVCIRTSDNIVTNVSTRQLMGLGMFKHYHQNNPDCWGSWSIPAEWKTPDDILTIADSAMAVLENINTLSMAIINPEKLPRRSTLMNNVIKNSESAGPITPNTHNVRIGDEPTSDVWASNM